MASRTVIRLRRVFLILLGLALAAAAQYAWRFVRHEPTRLALARRVLDATTGAEAPVFLLEGLRWPTLRELSADTLHLYNAEGAWLEARGITARLALRPLIGRTVYINALQVRSVAVAELPDPVDSPRRERARSPWRYILPAVHADAVRIEAAVSGVPVEAAGVEASVFAAASSGRVSVHAHEVSAFGEDGALRGELAWKEGAVAVTNLLVTTRAGVVTGAVQVGEGQTVVRLFTAGLDATPLAERFGDPARARLDASATITHRAGDTRIAWQVTAHEATRGAIVIPTLQTTGLVQRTNAAWRLHDACIDAPVINAGATAWRDATVRIRHDAQRLVADLAATATVPFESSVQARVGFSASEGTTTITLDHATAFLHGADLTLTQPATVRWSGRRWSLDTLALRWGDATLTTRAAWNGELNWSGQVHDVPVGALRIHDGWGGRAKLSWHLRDYPTHANGQLTLQVEEAATGIERIDPLFPEAVRATVRIRPDRLLLEAQSHGATNLSVLAHASAAGAWRLGDPWFARDGDVRGSVLLHAQLAPVLEPYLADWQQVRGQLKASLGLSGDPRAPAITGHVVIADGFIEDVVRGATVRDLAVHATIASRDHLHWTASARDDGRGEASLAGSAVRNEDGAMVLHAEASVARFILGRLLSTDLPINGRLELHGTGAVARLTGRLTTEPITVRLPRQLPPSIRTMRVVERGRDTQPVAEAPERTRREFPVRIATDIQLSAHEGIRVNGRQLRTEWRGRGSISGVIPDLRLGGSINLQRGSFMFLGRRFQVLRGDIIIPSGARTATPTVFITAETRASGATITLNIEGSADEPQLTLSSSPPLERNEIVSRLLFGKPGDAVSPFQIAYLAYALDLLEGGGPLLQQIDRGERTLGLDQLDIKQSEEESGLQAVIFGKRLLDRVYFEGEIGLEKEPDVFAVEAELTPTLILRTETSPRIREGISIQWRRDY